jgi:3'-5' exonuclease
MLENYNVESILFLDIETVPMVHEYNELPDNFKKLWDRKAESLARYTQTTPEIPVPGPAEVFERAGIYAEFGKIVCISTGVYRNSVAWVKSFYGDDEKVLLEEFVSFLVKLTAKNVQFLCAHNGKEFDFPYMIRRMLVNGVKVPPILDLSGKKPWEVNHVDTMELWKFGDFKNYTSLELLATLFGIPTPKDDIAGKDVARVYYEEKDLPRIVTYCQKDVMTIINLFLRFRGDNIIDESKVTYI